MATRASALPSARLWALTSLATGEREDVMKNVTLTTDQARVIAGGRWSILGAEGTEILLPSGCQLARLDSDSYLLKGYAYDSSDVDRELSRLG